MGGEVVLELAVARLQPALAGADHIGVLALLRSAYSSESYGPIMAGATLSAFPLLIVFLVANRRIVEGVRLSGLKG